MGTMIQQHKLAEADYRGDRFRHQPVGRARQQRAAVPDAAGIIERIHRDYLAAGADIIETNTFNANRDQHGRLRHGGDGPAN